MNMLPSAATAVPRVHVLSNGRYTTMLTDAGSGWSRWCGRAITRWREDPTRDSWGSYLLLCDADTGAVWSPTRQPLPSDPAEFVIKDGAGTFTSTRTHGDIETRLAVAVAPGCDAELRHLTISNHGSDAVVIEVTSYSEPVLGAADADAAHPAFSKLFVRTEWVASGGVLLATRRRQSPTEAETWFAQVALVEGQLTDTTEYISDRARFLGRGRTLQSAAAMVNDSVLEGSAGDVLDAVISLRRRVRVPAGRSVRLAFWNCAASSREKVLAIARTVAPVEHCEDVFNRARTFEEEARARCFLDDGCMERCGQLLAALLYSNPASRASQERLKQASGGAPVLWAAGISGDRPIVLLNILDESALGVAHELLRAQRYWEFAGIAVDLVMLNRSGGNAAASLDATSAAGELAASPQSDSDVATGEVFYLREDDIEPRLRDGLSAAARVVLPANEGPPCEDRSGDAGAREQLLPDRWQARVSAPAGGLVTSAKVPAIAPAELRFDNGYGGFTQAGDEYVIRPDAGECTPLPWSNVIANPSFGFIATAEGGGHTFSCNSQQNPLTPWPNDPVSDQPCEVLYLRDEESGALWSATPRPVPGTACNRITRHGKGWTAYSHSCDGLEVELLQCVPVADSVKLSRLRIHNRSGRVRKLSVTAYLQWALGANGTVPGPHVITSRDARTGALLAVNRWRPEFAERVAFADLGAEVTSFTCDRQEFLGIFGSSTQPLALRSSTPLGGWCGAGRDPCAAMQSTLEIAADESAELRFLLGDAASESDATELIQRARAFDIDTVLADIHALWDGVTATVQIDTPDPAMNVLLNHWLLYQVLSCRMWARTAYYQSSGAFGFRDQLQDVMALCIARPDLARDHLLLAASRQFVEGDVQHWWLPPAGQGIRTRMTDDRLWLPYSALHYVEVSGDAGVLDVVVPFLDGPPLEDGQHDAFFAPSVSDTRANLYEHCARALDVSMALGPHHLPLMGTGDWNDGMNRVGEQGRGESVWLGWFLLDVITRFAPVAESRGDSDRAARWRDVAASVKSALEGPGWDGAWYRRAYYDDGTPLGSGHQSECRIDGIAQSWAVMSGAADPERARQAMAATDVHLVDRRHRLMRLLTPPFEHGARNPGYIKAYPPGVRENGGQYTHGCIWSIFAWAKLEEGAKAWELFDFFNPVSHSSTRRAADHFKVEPYVSCADVYSVDPHAGRGGWTWYSGSAAWLYRAGMEALLGFHLRGHKVLMQPCIPATWTGFSLTCRYHGSLYRIRVENPDQVGSGIVVATLDGVGLLLADTGGVLIPLCTDGQEHRVQITMGAQPGTR